MPRFVLPALACVCLLEGYSVAAPVAQTSSQLASIGVYLGTLTAIFYFYREEVGKRLDRIERQIDSLRQDFVRWVKS